MGKTAAALLILLNVLGIVCLIVLAVPYLAHDTTVPNPDAMLPCERWDGAGFLLALGLLPLTAVNILTFVWLGRRWRPLPPRALCLLPCAVCAGIVIHYLAVSFLLP